MSPPPASPTPRLVALTGALEGEVFEISEDPFTLGRHSSCALQIRHISVSRRHCEIRRDGGRLVVRDLESRHGTFVNRRPVGERELDHGDLLQVTGSLFLVLLREAEADEADEPGELEESGWSAASTVHLSAAESRRAPAEILGALPRGGEAARRLEALLDLAAELGAAAAPETLARRLAERLAELLGAERTGVFLLGAGGEVERAWGAGAGIEDGRPPALSRTLAAQVLSGGTALLAQDVLREPELAGAESLLAQRIRSLLCAPLAAAEGARGLLYADTRDPGARFDETHLRLLAAAAALAAPAFEGARRLERLEGEKRRLREERALEHDMVGESPAMQEVYDFLARAAPTGSTVLLRGESGTGKELAARALHENSPRREGPFVAVNCATLSETLLESELFGHEKGAFTGALARKLGKLEAADGGTVFLDEVGEIPPPLQAKLLRALETREIERVGGTRPIRVDVRIVAATNRDLEAAMAEGGFRRDLFYRLDVLSLTLPPLRRRGGDVLLLARHFAARHGRRLGRPMTGLDGEAQRAIAAYDWPGNVRELANAIERAVVLGEGDVLGPEDLPEAVREAGTSPGGTEAAGYHGAVAEAKRRLILDAVEAEGGHLTRAAERLGLNPTYLHRLITNLGLRERLG